jgi:hypothetical protein
VKVIACTVIEYHAMLRSRHWSPFLANREWLDTFLSAPPDWWAVTHLAVYRRDDP